MTSNRQRLLAKAEEYRSQFETWAHAQKVIKPHKHLQLAVMITEKLDLDCNVKYGLQRKKRKKSRTRCTRISNKLDITDWQLITAMDPLTGLPARLVECLRKRDNEITTGAAIDVFLGQKKGTFQSGHTGGLNRLLEAKGLSYRMQVVERKWSQKPESSPYQFFKVRTPEKETIEKKKKKKRGKVQLDLFEDR